MFEKKIFCVGSWPVAFTDFFFFGNFVTIVLHSSQRHLLSVLVDSVICGILATTFTRKLFVFHLKYFEFTVGVTFQVKIMGFQLWNHLDLS